MGTRVLVALLMGLGITLGASLAVEQEPQDFLTTLTANPELSMFTQAFLTAEIQEELDPAEQWTIFAPANSALLADEALETPEEVAHYVVRGAYSEDDLWELASLEGATVPLTTLGGAEITVDIFEGVLRIGGAALIIEADVETTNGYVHIIDAAMPMAEALGDGG